MPVIFRGHGPLPQWISDGRFCLVAARMLTKSREQIPNGAFSSRGRARR